MTNPGLGWRGRCLAVGAPLLEKITKAIDPGLSGGVGRLRPTKREPKEPAGTRRRRRPAKGSGEASQAGKCPVEKESRRLSSNWGEGNYKRGSSLLFRSSRAEALEERGVVVIAPIEKRGSTTQGEGPGAGKGRQAPRDFPHQTKVLTCENKLKYMTNKKRPPKVVSI